LIKVVTRKLYKPRFYANKSMNLADLVDKISGPNKDWDIISDNEYKIRRTIEFETLMIVVTVITIFVLSIITLILIDLGNPFKIQIRQNLFLNSSFLVFLYFIVLFFFIHLSFSIKNKGLDFYIYGLLSVISSILFIYLLGSSYFNLLFGV